MSTTTRQFRDFAIAKGEAIRIYERLIRDQEDLIRALRLQIAGLEIENDSLRACLRQEN